MPRKRTPPKRPEGASPVQHFLKAVSPERLDRIEARLDDTNATLDRLAGEHAAFHRDMRAAILVQQEQIAEIRGAQAESARQILELAKATASNTKAIANLEKQLEAYLRRTPQ